MSVCQAALGHGLAECVESEAKQWGCHSNCLRLGEHTVGVGGKQNVLYVSENYGGVEKQKMDNTSVQFINLSISMGWMCKGFLPFRVYAIYP